MSPFQGFGYVSRLAVNYFLGDLAEAFFAVAFFVAGFFAAAFFAVAFFAPPFFVAAFFSPPFFAAAFFAAAFFAVAFFAAGAAWLAPEKRLPTFPIAAPIPPPMARAPRTSNPSVLLAAAPAGALAFCAPGFFAAACFRVAFFVPPSFDITTAFAGPASGSLPCSKASTIISFVSISILLQ